MIAREAGMKCGNGVFAAALFDPDIEIPVGVGDAQGDAAPRRYGVYRNNVVVGLMEALRSAFPSVLAIMGDASFDRVARNFIALHPPRSAMMQAYGEAFAGFLATFPPLREARYLADVARLERLFLDSFHAADAPALTSADLAGLSGGESVELVFSAHPALAILESPWPVVSLFAFREGRPDSAIDLSRPQRAMVTRPGHEVRVGELEEGAFEFLNLLLDGKTLGEAAGKALESHGGTDIGAALALFLQAGAFRRRDTWDLET